MKKILLALAAVAACAVSTASLAQPVRHGRPFDMRRAETGVHHKHKVWVPARRVHGRVIPGHYVRR